MANATRPAINCQQRPVVFRIGAELRRLHIDHAHQLAAGQHRHGEFTAHRIQCAEVARIVAHIGGKHRLACFGGDASESLAHRNHEVAHHFLAVPNGVPDAHPFEPFAIEQDGEQVRRHHLLYELRHVVQQLIEVEGFAGDRRHFQ